MNEADVLLVLGASFLNHTGITPKKPTIQVDRNPMILGKFHVDDVPVWGELGVICGMLRERLAERRFAVAQEDEVTEMNITHVLLTPTNWARFIRSSVRAASTCGRRA